MAVLLVLPSDEAGPISAGTLARLAGCCRRGLPNGHRADIVGLSFIDDVVGGWRRQRLAG